MATAFPSGQASLAVRLADVAEAVEAGADEIDMVINRGAFLAGQLREVFEEIVVVKEACGQARLKVILETGELGTLDNVRRASVLAMAAGADFIKTSTGKIQPAATLPVALVMLEAIRDFHVRTGRMVGMKPAGGVRTAKQAIQYLVVVNETLGPEWLTPDWFRLGASSLLNDCLMQLARSHRPLPVRRLLHQGLGGPDRPWQCSQTAGERAPARFGGLEYEPSPRDDRPRLAPGRHGLLIGGRLVEPASGHALQDDQPRHRGSPGRGGRGRRRGRRRGRHGGTARLQRVWAKPSGAERAKYLYRIARVLQERAREFAVLETMDGGKPIKESPRRRPPPCRRPLLLPRRLGRQARLRLPRAAARARSAWPARSSPGTSRC